MIGRHKLISLPKIEDFRGNLTFFENNNQIPFKIERVYWIYDVPGDEERGGHAFKHSQEVIIPLSGSFDVELSNGDWHETVHLRRSYSSLYVPPLIWRKLSNFSTNSLALIASSLPFNQSEYIYNAEELQNEF